MSVYVDANVLVSVISTDAMTAPAEAALRRVAGLVVVSDFCGAEIASVIGKRVRTSQITKSEGKAVLAAYDEWMAARAELVEMSPVDVSECHSYLRRLDLPLRTPDALHIAIASRIGASILSFDKQLLASARKLGVKVLRA